MFLHSSSDWWCTHSPLFPHFLLGLKQTIKKWFYFLNYFAHFFTHFLIFCTLPLLFHALIFLHSCELFQHFTYNITENAPKLSIPRSWNRFKTGLIVVDVKTTTRPWGQSLTQWRCNSRYCDEVVRYELITLIKNTFLCHHQNRNTGAFKHTFWTCVFRIALLS